MTAWQTVELQNCWTAELNVPLSLSLPLPLSANVYYEKRALLNGIVYFGFYLFLFYFFYFMIFVRARALMWVLFSLSFPRCICIFLSGGRRGTGWGEEALIMSAAATAAAVALNALIKDATTTTSRTARQQQQQQEQRSLRSPCRRAKLAQLQL